MIGEPELTGAGGPQGPRLPDVVADLSAGPGSGHAGPGRIRARGPWLWGALAGAAAVCAVWAGTASAAGSPAPGPDLHGMRIGSSPCAGGTFGALLRAVGAGSGIADPAVFSHGPALDSARCDFAVQAPARRGAATATRYDVAVSVDLHKTVDPRPEFDDQHGLDPETLAPADRTTALPGLGDEAYALALADGSEAVRVLRGGAVVTLRLTAAAVPRTEGAPGRPGAADAGTNDLTPALASAARTVLATLAG
jgi:hypothetical protein